MSDFLVELSITLNKHTIYPARIITYIEERAGTEFEPEAATAFVAMMKRVEAGIQVSPMPAAGDTS